MITRYHTTDAADEIIRNGFRDATGSYGLATLVLTGVWLADSPVDVNEGAKGDQVLRVEFPDGVDLADYELIEEGKPYCEWCVPAALINSRARVTFMTYADGWRDSINETYAGAHDNPAYFLDLDGPRDDEDDDAAVLRILTKAAQCLRNGVPATFTAGELDLVRHLMPAHEVHQSGSLRWVREFYGVGDIEDETGRSHQDDLNTAALAEWLGVPGAVAYEVEVDDDGNEIG